jgi:hypothetical protein
MNGAAILAVLGLMAVLAVVLTGAVWGTPMVTVAVRWLMN